MWGKPPGVQSLINGWQASLIRYAEEVQGTRQTGIGAGKPESGTGRGTGSGSGRSRNRSRKTGIRAAKQRVTEIVPRAGVRAGEEV